MERVAALGLLAACSSISETFRLNSLLFFQRVAGILAIDVAADLGAD